jgi:CubicO group peptidase (beta-lactamase class C family)
MIRFSKKKQIPYLGSLVLALGIIGNCTPKEETNDAQNLLFLGIGAGKCNSIDSCFNRFARTSDEGAALLVVDEDMNILSERETGNIEVDKHQIIFSASKWVTAATLMAVIEDSVECNTPALTLDSTTGTVLGWTGKRGQITLRQLLAFTSGLNDKGGSSGQAECIANLPNNATDTQKDACIEKIRTETKLDEPGALFVYNSNHMAVAQRMAEIACDETWQVLFNRLVATPLGWDTTQSKWVSGLRGEADGDGSLAGAYGLIVSTREYAGLMAAFVREGDARNFKTGTDIPGFLSPASITEIMRDQSEDSKIGYSQFAAFGYSWKYGLGNWRYCTVTDEEAECDKDLISHSVGANGYFPWLDRNRGYFGIVAVNNLGRKATLTGLPATANSLFFAETIRPLIHRELSGN